MITPRSVSRASSRAAAAGLDERNQQRRSSSAGVELAPISWRDQLSSQGELLPIWDLLQRISPDRRTKNLQRVLQDQHRKSGSFELARRLRLWELNAGLHTDDLFRIVAKEGLGLESLGAKNAPHILRRLMNLPLVELNLTAAQIGQTIHAFSGSGTHNAAASQSLVDATVNIDRGITGFNLVASLIENWSLDQQIKEAKAALEPAKAFEREELERQATHLWQEIRRGRGASSSTEGDAAPAFSFDAELFARLKDVLLLEVRLHPNQNQQLKAVLEESLQKLELSKQLAVKGAKRAALVLGVDVTQVVLAAVEPSGLASKLVGLAWKTYNAKAKVTEWTGAVQRVEAHREEKGLAARAIRRLDRFSKQDQDRELLATVRKVNQAYWEHQTQEATTGLLAKTMGIISSIAGISSVILKVLAIIGVIAAASAAIATLGYIALVIAGAALLLRLIVFLYQHRHEIRLYLQKAFAVVQRAFFQLSEKLGYQKAVDLKALGRRVRILDKQMACAKVAAKLSGVSPLLLRELGEKLKATGARSYEGLRKAQLVVEAITGKPAPYLEKSRHAVGLTDEELVDRTLASLITQLGGFKPKHLQRASRREQHEDIDVERDMIVEPPS